MEKIALHQNYSIVFAVYYYYRLVVHSTNELLISFISFVTLINLLILLIFHTYFY
jgi:hypothetical protein